MLSHTALTTVTNCLQTHTWFFIPKDIGKFVMKPSLIVWGQGSDSNTSGGKKKEFPVRVVGEGALGSIEVCLQFLQNDQPILQ